MCRRGWLLNPGGDAVSDKPGYCQCGCGRIAPIAKMTRAAFGHVQGQPTRYCVGHGSRMVKVKRYRAVRAQDGHYTPAHVDIVERALGHRLPAGAVVHHIDGNKTNNVPSNLVACQDRAYHNLLHTRQRAKAECGNPNWRMCWMCGKYDDPATMGRHKRTGVRHHRACHATRELARLHRKKAATAEPAA